MSICIIPARGGSKRIPKKNIKNFSGKPMISWSIMTAVQSGCFEKIVVSTDDLEIANIARCLGADTPFIRPSELADDYTSTAEVVEHALNFLKEKGQSFEYCCCLYATSPFTQSNDLQKGLKLLKASKQDTYVFSATSFPFPIRRAIKIDENGYSSALDSIGIQQRSQDMEEFFHDAGQFYWATSETWLSTKDIFSNGRPLILPRYRVQDIDTLEDWERAELMHAILQKA